MTILVVTFTYRGDEQLARFGAESLQTLRKLYPQHKIIHYLIDDASNPFETPYEQTENTRYIQTDFDRHGCIYGTEAFTNSVRTTRAAALEVNADWVVKLDSDTVLMSLDFLDEQYDYIGSSRKGEKKFYTWGGCVAYKVQTVRDIAAAVEDKEYLHGLEVLCTNKRWQQNEDVLFGYTATIKLGKSSLIGDLCTDGNLFMYISDSQTLNPMASAASCKGRYISWLYRPSLSHVTDKSLLTTESVLGRMREADNVVKNRVKAKFSSKESDSTPKYGKLKKMTILVATFTSGKDESLARQSADAVKTLRRIYPQFRIIHYIIDDGSHPFSTPFEDDGDTRYTQMHPSSDGVRLGFESFRDKVAIIAKLVGETGADWVVKTNADTVLMRLDNLNVHYDYIGSKGSEERGFQYVWGACCSFKSWVVREMNERLAEQGFVERIKKAYGIDEGGQAGDLLFGMLSTNELNAKMLSGDVGENGELCPFISDSAALNPTAYAVSCRGRFLKGMEGEHIAFVGDEAMLTVESILGRMKRSHSLLQERLKAKTVAIATFTYDQDEEITLLTAKCVDDLRKLYPHYKIFHYIVIDENHPFKGQYEDTDETFFVKSSFKRNGNLCGTTAFEGVTGYMDRIAKMTNADWVIKMDSDTVILSLDTLNSGYDFMGTSMCEEQKWCGGACLIFTGEAIKKLNELINNKTRYEQFLNLARAEGYPFVDDALMSAAAIEYFGFRCKVGFMYGFENTTIYWKDDWGVPDGVRAVVCKPQRLDEYKDEMEVQSISGRIGRIAETLKKRLK